MKMRWVNRGDSKWEAVAMVHDEGTPVWDAREAVLGVAVYTGSGADNYPWDWYLTDEGQARANAAAKSREAMRIRTTGVADTLRSAKQAVAYALNS